jgi:4a-hydroxytetrahydrobiopterin dehydratase
MSSETILSPDELNQALHSLPGWEIREGWLRRKFITPGWSHSVMLVSVIGYLADAAWHHPDLEVGYAQVVVKLQTHKVRGITALDTELARKIDEAVLWLPESGAALPGFPKKWVH